MMAENHPPQIGVHIPRTPATTRSLIFAASVVCPILAFAITATAPACSAMTAFAHGSESALQEFGAVHEFI
jgi:hypothetical protein